MNMLTTRNYDYPTTFFLDDLIRDIFTLEAPKIKSSSDVFVRDLEEAHEISIAAPGLKREDFKVNLDGPTLTISYERSKEDHRIFSKKNFSKSWTVSKNLNPKDVSAKYDAGVLVLTVKKPESEIIKAHQIEVQ